MEKKCHKHSHKKLNEEQNNLQVFAKYSLTKLQKKIKNHKLSLSDESAWKYNHFFGLNQLQKKSKWNWIKKILQSIFSLFNFLLMIIIAIQILNYFFLADIKQKKTILIMIIFVGAMIFLASFTEFINYLKFFRINSKLKSKIENKIYCLRNCSYYDLNLNNQKEIIKKAKLVNFKDIARYDLIYFRRGDVLPGDIRILFSNQLKINESRISGESKAVVKGNEIKTKKSFSLANIIYANCTVTNGYGVGIVFNRLNNSLIGNINQKLITSNKKSFFDLQFNKIMKWLFFGVIFFSSFIIAILCLFNLSSLSNYTIWIQFFIFGFAIGVSLIPESLTMILAANMAIGSKRLAKKGMILKQTKAIQALGSVKTFFVDKTGTLTKNQLTFHQSVNCNLEPKLDVLKLGYLNAVFQDGLEINNSVDLAIKQESNFLSIKNLTLKKLDEIPFDFKSRLIAILYQNQNLNRKQVVIKGSFLEVFNLCKYVFINKQKVLLTPSLKAKIKANFLKIQNNYLKIIAVCNQDNVNYQLFASDFLTNNDYHNLVFQGFILFSDDIRSNVKVILQRLKNEFNIDVKILSGDDFRVIKAIANKIDFDIKHSYSGLDLNQNHDLTKANIFYKINPYQKEDIIKFHQKKKQIVGFLGDGINDSLGLNVSDSSIAMENGTEIAKQSSDIILTKKDLKIILSGFKQGRIINANIIKYLKLTIANKVSLAAFYFLSIFVLKFFGIQQTTILTPVEILFLDFMFDLTQSVVIFDRVEKNLLLFPKKVNLKNIFSFVCFNSFVMTLVFLINLIICLVMALGLHNQNFLNTIEFANILHTTSFLTIGIVFLSSLFILRTQFSIFKKESFPPTIMFVGILTIMILIFLAPLLSLNSNLNFLKLTLFQNYFNFYYLIIFALVGLYWFLEEMTKKIYVYYFQTWF